MGGPLICPIAEAAASIPTVITVTLIRQTGPCAVSSTNGFQSNGSYHPANFSISSDSDSDIDCVMPQFEDPTFLDSDEEQEYKAGGDGSELDLLEDLLFWAWGLIFGGGDSEDEDDHKLEEEYLPPAFQEHPAICNAYVYAFLLAALKLSMHNAIQMHLKGVALAL